MALDFEDLNEDAISEILLRLPAKSILRFKTVSKQWLSITSNPVFRQIQASRSIDYVTGLFFRKVENRNCRNQVQKFLPLNGGKITTSILPSITSSSGGLLLLQPNPSGFTDYIVCNPTTNDFKQLPLPPRLISDSPHVLPYLAFDARKSPHYKVLFMCPDKHFGINRFEYVIYSSETETFSWPKELLITCLKFYLKSLIYGGYCNDAMHWILDEKKLFYCFNLNTEIMKCGPLPHGLICSKYFGESRGHLLLVAMTDNRNEILVYELNSDYSGWSVKFRIIMKFISNALPNGDDIYLRLRLQRCGFTVLSIVVDSEDEENVLLVLTVNGYFVEYNCKHKQCVMLGGGNKMRGVCEYEGFHSWQYMETLACI